MEDPITSEIRKIIRSEIQTALQALPRTATPAVVEPEVTCTCICSTPTWSTKQAAAYLGIAPKTLRNKISKGEFPRPIKHDRLNAFTPSEVEGYWASTRTDSASTEHEEPICPDDASSPHE